MNTHIEQTTPPKSPEFIFPKFDYRPVPGEFYPIAKEYAKFLVDNQKISEVQAWVRACDTIFSKYQPIINGLDQTKTIFIGILDNAKRNDRAK